MQEFKPDISEQMNKMKTMKVVFKQGFNTGLTFFWCYAALGNFPLKQPKKSRSIFFPPGFSGNVLWTIIKQVSAIKNFQRGSAAEPYPWAQYLIKA